MIRRLIATTILLAVAAILVSPGASLAMQHQRHHHQTGLVANSPQSASAPVESRYESSVAHATSSLMIGFSVSAMRC